MSSLFNVSDTTHRAIRTQFWLGLQSHGGASVEQLVRQLLARAKRKWGSLAISMVMGREERVTRSESVMQLSVQGQLDKDGVPNPGSSGRGDEEMKWWRRRCPCV